MARFPRHASKTTRLHLEMDTWGEDVAIFTPKSMHGAKMLPARGLIARIRRKGNAYGAILARWAQVRRNARKGCEVYGAARWVTPLGRATRQVAAPTGWAWRARRGEDATLVGAGQARRWRAWRCGDAALAGSAAIASWHVVAWARAWQRWRAERDAGGRAARRRWDAALVAALGLTARRARWKRVTVGREGSGLTRRNTPTRAAVIRPNWRALPQRALRALR